MYIGCAAGRRPARRGIPVGRKASESRHEHRLAPQDEEHAVPLKKGEALEPVTEKSMVSALPLLMLGMGSRRIASVRQGAFLGLMSGIGFAAAEGVGYTLQATVLASQFGTFREQFLQFLFRVMTGPVLHASWAGIVGWFIGVAATRGQRRWPVVTLGILFAGTLHGLYDFCSGNVVGIMLAGLTFLIFLSYLADGEQALAESAATLQPDGVASRGYE